MKLYIYKVFLIDYFQNIYSERESQNVLELMNIY